MLLLPLLFYISCCFQEADDDRTLTNIRHRLARTGLLHSVFLLSRKKNWQTKLLLGLICCQMGKTMRTHKGQNTATLPPSRQQKNRKSSYISLAHLPVNSADSLLIHLRCAPHYCMGQRNLPRHAYLFVCWLVSCLFFFFKSCMTLFTHDPHDHSFVGTRCLLKASVYPPGQRVCFPSGTGFIFYMTRRFGA